MSEKKKIKIKIDLEENQDPKLFYHNSHKNEAKISNFKLIFKEEEKDNLPREITFKFYSPKSGKDEIIGLSLKSSYLSFKSLVEKIRREIKEEEESKWKKHKLVVNNYSFRLDNYTFELEEIITITIASIKSTKSTKKPQNGDQSLNLNIRHFDSLNNSSEISEQQPKKQRLDSNQSDPQNSDDLIEYDSQSLVFDESSPENNDVNNPEFTDNNKTEITEYSSFTKLHPGFENIKEDDFKLFNEMKDLTLFLKKLNILKEAIKQLCNFELFLTFNDSMLKELGLPFEESIIILNEIGKYKKYSDLNFKYKSQYDIYDKSFTHKESNLSEFYKDIFRYQNNDITLAISYNSEIQSLKSFYFLAFDNPKIYSIKALRLKIIPKDDDFDYFLLFYIIHRLNYNELIFRDSKLKSNEMEHFFMAMNYRDNKNLKEFTLDNVIIPSNPLQYFKSSIESNTNSTNSLQETEEFILDNVTSNSLQDFKSFIESNTNSNLTFHLNELLKNQREVIDDDDLLKIIKMFKNTNHHLDLGNNRFLDFEKWKEGIIIAFESSMSSVVYPKWDSWDDDKIDEFFKSIQELPRKVKTLRIDGLKESQEIEEYFK